MKILFISRDNSEINKVAEAATIYCMYLMAEEALFATPLVDLVNLWYESKRRPDSVIIELYYTFYNDDQTAGFPKKKMLELNDKNKKILAVKHKTKLDLQIIARHKSIMNTLRKDVEKYFDYIFTNNGFNNWKELVLCEESHGVIYDGFKEDSYEEDIMLPLISETIVENKVLLMFAGNIGNFMKECRVEENKTTFSNIGTPDFYSFPLFRIPNKIPLPNDEPLSQETMIKIRNHFQEKIKSVSGMIKEFEKEIRIEDFGKNTKEKMNCFYEKIKPDATMFQEQTDKEIYLQQMKNSSENCYDIEIRVGVIKLGKIPEYFEKAKIIQAFVANSLKKNLERLLDTEKCELFLYCKLPEDLQKRIDVLYKK